MLITNCFVNAGGAGALSEKHLVRVISTYNPDPTLQEGDIVTVSTQNYGDSIDLYVLAPWRYFGGTWALTVATSLPTQMSSLATDVDAASDTPFWCFVNEITYSITASAGYILAPIYGPYRNSFDIVLNIPGPPNDEYIVTPLTDDVLFIFSKNNIYATVRVDTTGSFCGITVPFTGAGESSASPQGLTNANLSVLNGNTDVTGKWIAGAEEAYSSLPEHTNLIVKKKLASDFTGNPTSGTRSLEVVFTNLSMG